MNMKIREQLLDKLLGNPSLEIQEFAELGIPYPPKKGWYKRFLVEHGLYDQHKAVMRRKRKAGKARRRAERVAKMRKPPRVNYAQKRASDKAFYASWEWKKVRFEVLKKYGPVCMLCNSRERIVVDHIKPRSKFPDLQLDPDNCQVLCNDCNMGKSNDDFTDFRPEAQHGELELVWDAARALE